MEICVIFVILDLVWYQLILSILPDVNKSVSLLVLELLDACNHFVVNTVSICSPKKINMVNSCTSIQHTESLIWSSEKTKLQKYFTIALRIGISGITHNIQYEEEHSTCKQRLRFSLSSSQELEQDPCLLVTAKEKENIKNIVFKKTRIWCEKVMINLGDCKIYGFRHLFQCRQYYMI